MAKIPVKKMNDGSTNYFPVSVLNSVFVNEAFTVKNTIGGLKAGAEITANSTLAALMTRILVDEGMNVEIELNKKVDKVENKGLSTNDFTDTYKTQLDELQSKLDSKVDKVDGSRLMTDAESTKLESLENYDDSEIRDLIDEKVSIEEGKVLSSNDFTDDDKQKLDDINTDLYVEKEDGKGLSTCDFTEAYRNKLENMSDEAYVKKDPDKGLSTNDYTDAEQAIVSSLSSDQIVNTIIAAFNNMNSTQKEDFKAIINGLDSASV